MEETFDVIIVGGGPAGLSAGIYASRAKLSTLILNEGAVGGQMVLTHEIANYPGVEKTSGYQLANIMKKQAREFGAKIKSNVNIAGYDLTGFIKRITLEDGTVFKAWSVILAQGGSPRSLGVAGEDRFRGAGISYCATCDGEFFTDKEIVVIGGGNSALEEAVSLTKYAKKVTIIHQFDHFQAFEHAIMEAKKNEKIEFILQSTIEEFKGTDRLQSVVIHNLQTGLRTEYPAQGAFIFIGYIPNTGSLNGILELNSRKEVVVNADMQTNLAGVFAAGDMISKRFRQVTTAVADGTIAALVAAEHVHSMKTLLEKEAIVS